MTRTELRNQIAKCRRLARFTDAETARRLLELAAEYEARVAQPQIVAEQSPDGHLDTNMPGTRPGILTSGVAVDQTPSVPAFAAA